MFGLGAINLAKNPDGLFALVGQPAARSGAAKEREAGVALAEIDLHEVEHAPANGRSTDATTDGDPMHLRRRGRASFGSVDQPVPTADAASRSTTSSPATATSRCCTASRSTSRPGSVVALLGANGAGKSTLCGVAAGLLTPSSGTVALAAAT